MATKIAVLMSTYNGEMYLASQIESILNQKGVSVDLYVRDDGSTDNTCAIIQEYVQRYKNIYKLNTKAKGVGCSFISLLSSCKEYPYFAFADQDDVWDSDKLITAIAYINKYNLKKPVLYCCNQRCVDYNLNFLSLRFSLDYKIPSLMELVFANYFAGCTMVMNLTLRTAICNNLPSNYFFVHRIHDAWIACVAKAIGEIIFDYEPHMDFRRTGNNFSDDFVPGKKIKKFKRFLQKLKRFSIIRKRLNKNGVQLTAKEILHFFSDRISPLDLKNLQILANYNDSFMTKIKLLNSGIIQECCPDNEFYITIKALIGLL